MARTFAGFMSYVRVDDQHENGRLSELCSRLAGEVRMQLGEKFLIFQDRNDIAWGQQWKERIEGALDATTFLIPIITPGFFKSTACRDEVERFFERERKLVRSDLILPIYYVSCPILNDETLRATDFIAEAISARQYADWRELRFEPFASPSVGKTLAALAGQIIRALEPQQVSAAAARVESAVGAGAQQTGDEAGRNPSSASVEEVPRSGTRKEDPPTLVVDALHRGDHPTLTDALAAAVPGCRILVRPGLYREGVIINKAVEIVGDGDPGEVVIEAAGCPVIQFRASMGRAVNLTIRHVGEGRWYSVDIGQGRLDLEACDITNASFAGVAIHDGADPRLRRNRIHDCKQSGVFIFANGLGTLEDNEIFGNLYSGIEIKSSNPTLRRNRIYNGRQSGLHFHENALGVVEDNEIFANDLSNVSIKSGSNPMLRRNRIHGAKQGGVFIQDGGLGTLEDNDIFGNALSGVEIKGGGNPTLRRNLIHDGQQNGVFVHESGLGTLEDNDFFGNGLSGIEIKSGGNPTLRRNRINKGKRNGAYVHSDGLGTLEDNEIADNLNNGIRVTSGGNPTIRGNRIQGSGKSGVYVHENGLGILENNEIFKNARAGVEVKSGGNPTIRQNVIRENLYEAVWVYNEGRAQIVGNDLRDNVRGALDISEECKSAVKVERNQE